MSQLFTAMDALADGGVKMGLPRGTALTLAAQTMVVGCLLAYCFLLYCAMYIGCTRKSEPLFVLDFLGDNKTKFIEIFTRNNSSLLKLSQIT